MDIFGLIALAKSQNGNGNKKTIFHFNGTKQSVDNLPTSGQDGDVYKIEQNSHYYAWSDNGWTDIGNILDINDVETYVNNELSKFQMLSFEEVEIIQ